VITYGSICSGIEAASVAWHPLGLRAEWFAEIEPFPSAVLAYRWPEVSNLGDMTSRIVAAGCLDFARRLGEIVLPRHGAGVTLSARNRLPPLDQGPHFAF
jgi:hypothetical protein